MQLSKKTWHYWLYTQYFSKYKVPNNLCPYFWRVVLSVIIFVPTNIIALPWTIVKGIIAIFNKDEDSKFKYPRFFEDFGEILGVYIGTLALFCMVAMWWHIPQRGKDGDGVFICGVACWVLIFVGLFALLMSHLKEKREERRYKKRQLSEGYVREVPQPNILIAFIKAKYQKHCPIIEWTDKD